MGYHEELQITSFSNHTMVGSMSSHSHSTYELVYRINTTVMNIFPTFAIVKLRSIIILIST